MMREIVMMREMVMMRKGRVDEGVPVPVAAVDTTPPAANQV